LPPTDSSTEDTLDLKLSPQILALLAATPPSRDDDPRDDGPAAASERPAATERPAGPTGPTGRTGPGGRAAHTGPASLDPAHLPRTPRPARADLLDHIGDWPAADSPAGHFRLVPVRPQRDLALVARWMNDPAVAEFWELAGDPAVTERHLRPQLTGDGRSVPCLGVLDGAPMSYWEIYRADLDPLARHYPARPHDTGVHLLVGGVADRARGLGSTLLRTVATMVLDNRPACSRVVAEPDLRNTPSVSAFLTAGFRFCAEVDLPGKRAALMIRDRTLRHLL